MPAPPLPADLLVKVLTAAAALVGLAILIAITVIALCSGEPGLAAVPVSLPAAVMSPFTVALPAAIRVALAERGAARRGPGSPAPGRPRARGAPPAR
ncbi:hypothetical protein; putative signal peptide [Frankia alni ACN14a]|uniref:Uncharacterized protein n=1 Tax=Frankia alni (strain DSM 45986 / CECT 9034 / ACN14a) TaxID=326424 RepID=Q0RJ32_FRAAA|nr:hypothetical protein; putative signal peptide [Frankia alni ACN14a]